MDIHEIKIYKKIYQVYLYCLVKLTPNNIIGGLFAAWIIGGPLLVFVGGGRFEQPSMLTALGLMFCFTFTLMTAFMRYGNRPLIRLIKKYDRWSTDKIVEKWDEAELEENKIRML